MNPYPGLPLMIFFFLQPVQLWCIPFFWIQGTIVAGQSLILSLIGNGMNQWTL